MLTQMEFRASLLAFFSTALAVWAGDPRFYTRQSTWQDTLIASLNSLEHSELRDGITPFYSPTFRGGDRARKISIPLGDARELYLVVVGCPDKKWAIGDWADARLVREDGSVEYLHGGTNCRPLVGRLENNLTLRSGLYQKLSLGGEQYERGLNVQAPSIVVIPLEDKFTRFEATIGVDDWAGTNGAVRFSVLGARSGMRELFLDAISRDFSEALARRQMNWEREDRIWELDWQEGKWQTLATRYAQACFRVPPLVAQAQDLLPRVKGQTGMERLRELYYRSRQLDASLTSARTFDWQALELAVADLESTFSSYPTSYRERTKRLLTNVSNALHDFKGHELAAYEQIQALEVQMQQLKREALLANPSLDFHDLLVIKRKPIGDARRPSWDGYGYGEFIGVPRQSSWGNGTMPNIDKWDNELAVVPLDRQGTTLTTLYRPPERRLLTDVDLHWDAGKLLFSMPDSSNRWQVFELTLGPKPAIPVARQLTPSHPDVHNYDAIYLPDERIDFISTAPLQGVPCNSGVIVGMLYQMDGNGHNIRQIAFEQDHDYTPSVLNDGRVLYLRWDYTDTPHIWNRILMSMNPDGTGQMEYYGANSYWPNAIFYARAIPNHLTKVVGIVTGHHEGRVGDLVVFDPARGRHETNGVVQRIPGRGKPVEPKKEDKLTEHNWPKFLHPWPLNEHYFIVACKPEPDALWGIYLADAFDNLVLLKEAEGFVLLEPIPFKARTRPPVIEDKVRPQNDHALVYLEDVYSGPGLRGVPRGEAKSLRIFTYHFGYQRLAGIDHRVGADGPWEAKRILGTVPIEADGSALFRVPARTPLSFQPLDGEGRALALMRSWMTAMPGENVSCIGCHDHKNSAPLGPNRRIALTKTPAEIVPWLGAAPRGFSFAREVQPVLDRYCVGCHDGSPANREAPDLRRDQDAFVVYEHGKLDGKVIKGVPKDELLGKFSAVFEPAYNVLRQYVRVGGLESDLHVLPPMEFHAGTSELIQMLRKGHHGVRMDSEAWERLFAWIDLNAPCHGRWSDVTKIPGPQCERRLELRKLYGGVIENCEEAPAEDAAPVQFVPPPAPAPKPSPPSISNWPLSNARARQLQVQAAGSFSRSMDVGNGITLELVRIPAGEFLMGDPEGAPDEQPTFPVHIEKPFWIGKFEVSNDQFAQFDSTHDSRFEHRTSWIFSEAYLGWPLDRPRQPVVRVSWEEAMAFCRWLSERTGHHVTLPTEAQWEWACRAGTASPFSFGDFTTKFSPFGNMGDASLRRLADEGWRPKSPDLVIRDDRFNDGELVSVEIGSYASNPWGLHDMHGNVAEWTRTTWQPYPYVQSSPSATSTGEKVVRGGSWRDRPQRCRSGSRLAYQPWQKVFNVGFRVVVEVEPKTVAQK